MGLANGDELCNAMGNALGKVEGNTMGEVEGGALGEGEGDIEGERVLRRLPLRVCARPCSATRRTCPPLAPTPLMPRRSRPAAPAAPPPPVRFDPPPIGPVAPCVERVPRVTPIPRDLDPTMS